MLVKKCMSISSNNINLLVLDQYVVTAELLEIAKPMSLQEITIPNFIISGNQSVFPCTLSFWHLIY